MTRSIAGPAHVEYVRGRAKPPANDSASQLCPYPRRPSSSPKVHTKGLFSLRSPHPLLLIPPTELFETPHKPLLLVLLPRDPKLFAPLHNVREHRAAEKDHVLSARRVLDADLEVLRATGDASVSGNLQGSQSSADAPGASTSRPRARA